jgi:hypothetical protein
MGELETKMEAHREMMAAMKTWQKETTGYQEATWPAWRGRSQQQWKRKSLMKRPKWKLSEHWRTDMWAGA